MSVDNFIKVFSNIVKKCYFGGFCCKVGVYYCLYSEISHQRKCSEKKICQIKVRKVLNSENKDKIAVAGKVL